MPLSGHNSIYEAVIRLEFIILNAHDSTAITHPPGSIYCQLSCNTRLTTLGIEQEIALCCSGDSAS